MAMLFTHGWTQSGLVIRHLCGNPLCINYHHLEIGTPQQNSDDKKKHGTNRRTDRLEFSVKRRENHSIDFFSVNVLIKRQQPYFKGYDRNRCFDTPWLPKTYDGYPQIKKNDLPGKVNGAHRLLYALFVGPLSNNETVGHTCGNNGCMNPYHLYIDGYLSDDYLNDNFDKRRTIKSNHKFILADLRISSKDAAKIINCHLQTVVSWRIQNLGTSKKIC